MTPRIIKETKNYRFVIDEHGEPIIEILSHDGMGVAYWRQTFYLSLPAFTDLRPAIEELLGANG